MRKGLALGKNSESEILHFVQDDKGRLVDRGG